MTKKENIIKAITEMNINLLDVLLDDDKPYMGVTKNKFLDELDKKFETFKQYYGVTIFSEVIPGICEDDNSLKGYTFWGKGDFYLDVVIDDIESEVNDIFVCRELTNSQNIKKGRTVIFNFLADEKIDFHPDDWFIRKKNDIDDAMSHFNKFKNNTTDFELIYDWCKNQADLIDINPFNDNYRAFQEFDSIKWDIYSLDDVKEKHSIAIKALQDYKKIDSKDEKVILRWLLNYKDDKIYSFLGTPEELLKKNIVLLSDRTNVFIDCSKYKESIEFGNIYSNHEWELMQKYKPTKEHYKQNVVPRGCSLEVYLAVHNMYPDILAEFNKSELPTT